MVYCKHSRQIDVNVNCQIAAKSIPSKASLATLFKCLAEAILCMCAVHFQIQFDIAAVSQLLSSMYHTRCATCKLDSTIAHK